MADVYVYHFLPFAADGAPPSRSLTAATLAAITKIGIPIMESQTVVDGSEVDAAGFLAPAAGFGASALTLLRSEIKSLELRAAARDLQALSMNAVTDGAAIYMLSLESCYLRQQAQKLAIEHAELVAEESGPISVVMAFPEFERA